MALETFKQEDADQMKRAEAALVQAMLPWRESTSPMLLAIVFVRMARVVLRLCNKNDQQQLRPVLIAYLEGKVAPPKGEGGLLWMPDGPVM
jgi:hypothetical protein